MLKFFISLLFGIKYPVIVSYRDSKNVVSALEGLDDLKGNVRLTEALM